MLTCSRCKKEVEDAMSFCPYCGAKMGANEKDENLQATQQHLKTATSSMAAALKEVSGMKNVGLTAAAGLALLGIVIFLFPWVSFWGFSESGFNLAFSGAPMFLLLLIPIGCIASIYFYYGLLQGKVKIEMVRKIMLAGSGVSILMQTVIYFTGKSRSMGVDLFTGWFYFAFIIWVGIIAVVVWDMQQSKGKQT